MKKMNYIVLIFLGVVFQVSIFAPDSVDMMQDMNIDDIYDFDDEGAVSLHFKQPTTLRHDDFGNDQGTVETAHHAKPQDSTTPVVVEKHPVVEVFDSGAIGKSSRAKEKQTQKIVSSVSGTIPGGHPMDSEEFEDDSNKVAMLVSAKDYTKIIKLKIQLDKLLEQKTNLDQEIKDVSVRAHNKSTEQYGSTKAHLFTRLKNLQDEALSLQKEISNTKQQISTLEEKRKPYIEGQSVPKGSVIMFVDKSTVVQPVAISKATKATAKVNAEASLISVGTKMREAEAIVHRNQDILSNDPTLNPRNKESLLKEITEKNVELNQLESQFAQLRKQAGPPDKLRTKTKEK